MLIAVDIDEVLADTLNTFLKKYNQKHKTHFIKGQFYTFDWWEILGISFDEFTKCFLGFIDNGFFKEIPVLDGAKAGIAELTKNNDLIAVTSRPKLSDKDTREWMDRHFSNVFSRIYYTRDEYLGEEKESKYHICQRVGAKALIEDQAKFAQDCAQNGLQVFLFDAPWNKNVKEASKMKRVYSWPEIIEALAA